MRYRRSRCAFDRCSPLRYSLPASDRPGCPEIRRAWLPPRRPAAEPLAPAAEPLAPAAEPLAPAAGVRRQSGESPAALVRLAPAAGLRLRSEESARASELLAPPSDHRAVVEDFGFPSRGVSGYS